MALILVQKDSKNLMPVDATAGQRTTYMQNFAIYDVNSDNSLSGPFGPMAATQRAGALTADVSGNVQIGPDGRLVGITAAQLSGLVLPRLTQIPFISSGFALPTSGALASTIGGGDAFINGTRVILPATAVVFPASKDTYVDLTQAGTIVLVSVANGATVGMTQTPNSLRIGKVVTGASAVTSSGNSSTLSTKDPLGNWMGNYSPLSYAYIATGAIGTGSYNAGITMTATTAASEVYDNDNMHSTSTFPSRLTINKTGLYVVGSTVFNSAAVKNTLIELRKNGTVIPNCQNRQDTGANSFIFYGTVQSPPLYLVAGTDYVEGFVSSTDVAASVAGGLLYAMRIA